MSIKETIVRKRKEILVVVFIFVLISVFYIFFSKKLGKPKETSMSLLERIEPNIKMNFEVLENPILEELEIFGGSSLPEEKGRENPFLPY